MTEVDADVGAYWTLILAGGFGTRLASALPDRPKVLAPVGDRAFLDVLLEALAAQGLRRIALLLGVRHEQVVAHLAARPAPGDLEVATVIEPEPRGTGGAIKLAARYAEQTFFALNGDTFLDWDPRALLSAHRAARALVTIAAIPVDDAGRYGSLEVGKDGRLRALNEKTDAGRPGLVSAGVYVMEPRVLETIAEGRAISLEREVLPALLARGERVGVMPQAGAFFDIGTEESWRQFTAFQSARRAAARHGDSRP